MNNKYELDDTVYFLNFETNKELAVNLLNFLPNKSFKDFCCCGKIIGMHITKEFEIFQLILLLPIFLYAVPSIDLQCQYRSLLRVYLLIFH